MNETIQTILKRRSVRAYKPEQIKREDVELIVECALSAPSTVNCQNWHFTVVRNADLIKKMSDEIKTVIPDEARQRYLQRFNGDENFSMFYNAPTLIVVSGAKSTGIAGKNSAFAVENICLAAESLGLGSCIVGMIALLFKKENAEEYRQLLGVPEDYEVQFAVCLGYKNMEMPKPERIPNKVNYVE